MPENLYFPMGLLGAGVVAWLSAGVVFILTENTPITIEIIKAGTGAMAIGGATYQVQTRVTAKKPTTTRRKPAARKPTAKP